MASIISSIKRKLVSILPLSGDSGAEPTRSVDSGETSGGSGTAATSELNVHHHVNEEDERPRKRQRLQHSFAAAASGTATPHLLSESTPLSPSSVLKLSKELFVDDGGDASSSTASDRLNSPRQSSPLLRLLPNDVLSHCISYINTPSDRFALQVSCSTLCKLSNAEDMLATLELGGNVASVTNVYSPFYILENAGPENNDNTNNNNNEGVAGNNNNNDHDGGVNNNAGVAAAVEAVNDVEEPESEDDEGEDTTGMPVHRLAVQSRPPLAVGGIILDEDDSVTACKKLIKYAAAGNSQAIYMIAMILCYCHENISEGLALLRHNASNLKPHLPSVYALALILRDSRSVESDYYLNTAASLGFAPAWQEKLTAAEMRAQFGDLDAQNLVRYLDPPCLNKLLGRHYLECQRVRKHQTSHCWNPLCGRWAYKALRMENNARQRRRALFQAMLNEGRQDIFGEMGIGRGVRFFQEGDGAFRQIFGERNENGVFEPLNANNNVARAGGDVQGLGDAAYRGGSNRNSCQHVMFSIETLLPSLPEEESNEPTNRSDANNESSTKPSPLAQLWEALRNKKQPQASGAEHGLKVSRMKMCSSCRRAKYCSKLCQVYDWRSGRHKMECQFL